MVRSVERAGQILDVLLAAPAGLRLTELSAALGLHKTTVLRLLRTRTALHWVYKGSDDHYRWQPLRWLLVARNLRDTTVKLDLVQEVLQRLVDATGQTAVLSVPDASSQMMAKVVSVMPRCAVRLDLRDYAFAALHASAAGKVYLADLPLARNTALLARPLPAYTPRTLSPEGLLAQLAEVRQQGYAVALGEHMPDTGAVAVAIREARGQLVGALALAGPVELYESAGFEEWMPLLRATATRLAELLYALPTTLLPSAAEIVPETGGAGVPRDETKSRKVFRVL